MLAESPHLVLNLSTLQLQGAGTRIDVTDPESQLLCALARAPGCRMEAAALLEQFAIPLDDAGKRALGVRVVRLRKKLLAAGASKPTIKSIRCSGYQLCVPLAIHTRASRDPLPSRQPPNHHV